MIQQRNALQSAAQTLQMMTLLFRMTRLVQEALSIVHFVMTILLSDSALAVRIDIAFFAFMLSLAFADPARMKFSMALQ